MTSWIEQAQQIVDETWHQKEPFRCDICRRPFSTLRGLQTHLGKTHDIAGKYRRKDYWKKYYHKNRTKRKRQSKAYYNSHREESQAYNRAYHRRNRERLLIQMRERRKKRKEKNT